MMNDHEAVKWLNTSPKAKAMTDDQAFAWLEKRMGEANYRLLKRMFARHGSREGLIKHAAIYPTRTGAPARRIAAP